MNKEMHLISDLASLVDQEILNDNDINSWKIISYKTDSFEGNMLAGGYGVDLKPIKISLPYKGKFRISLGLYGFVTQYKIRAKFSEDLCFQTITPPLTPEDYFAPVLYEVYWKEIELDGQSLLIDENKDPNFYSGALAFVRLEEIDDFQSHKSNSCCPLAITEDGSGIFQRTKHKKAEDLFENFEAVSKDSSLRILLWGNGDADVCNYPTKVGDNHTFPPGQSLQSRYNLYSYNNKLWQEKGWNSMKLVRDYAAQRQWEFHVYIRMEAFASQFPFDFIKSNFFNNHPEYHCRDRSGKAVLRLSYAYPEVQEHMLELIKEISSYNPDGVCLCFIRGVPLVLYEDIMVKGFKDKYAVDPRNLDEMDNRWLEYKAEVITGFVAKAKKALKEGQRLSIMVPGNEQDCRKWGLEPEKWARLGIVDDIYPAGQKFSAEDIHLDAPENLDFNYFNTLPNREKLRIIPLFYPWTTFNNDYEGWKKIILSCIKEGADAYAVWDALQFSQKDHLFFQEFIDKINIENHFDKHRHKCIKLTELNGFRYDRYHHYEVV